MTVLSTAIRLHALARSFDLPPPAFPGQTSFDSPRRDCGRQASPGCTQRALKRLNKPPDCFLPVAKLAAVCTGYDVQRAAAVNLVGKALEQALSLRFAEAGRPLYIEEELHSCLAAVDVLTSWTSAARELELQFGHRNDQLVCYVYVLAAFVCHCCFYFRMSGWYAVTDSGSRLNGSEP